MAYCSWICSTFCFFAGCTIIISISFSGATTTPIVIPSNTSNATSNDTAVEYVDYREISDAKRAGVVTIEYHFKTDNETDADSVSAVHRRTREVVVKVLNARAESPGTTAEPVDNGTTTAEDGVPGGGGRRRRRAAATYDVELVSVDPPVKDERLRTAVVAADQDGKVVPAEELADNLRDNKQRISDDTGHTVADIYVGLPPDARLLASLEGRPTIWQKHFWMFMVVLILIIVAIVTGVLCCICWYCCRKTEDKGKQPPAPEKKAPVEEKFAPIRAAPIQQSAPPPRPVQPPMKEEPTMTAAPPPPPAHSDDENGWIVPLDQLSQDELDQPDVQISRL